MKLFIKIKLIILSLLISFNSFADNPYKVEMRLFAKEILHPVSARPLKTAKAYILDNISDFDKNTKIYVINSCFVFTQDQVTPLLKARVDEFVKILKSLGYKNVTMLYHTMDNPQKAKEAMETSELIIYFNNY